MSIPVKTTQQWHDEIDYLRRLLSWAHSTISATQRLERDSLITSSDYYTQANQLQQANLIAQIKAVVQRCARFFYVDESDIDSFLSNFSPWAASYGMYVALKRPHDWTEYVLTPRYLLTNSNLWANFQVGDTITITQKLRSGGPVTYSTTVVSNGGSGGSYFLEYAPLQHEDVPVALPLVGVSHNVNENAAILSAEEGDPAGSLRLQAATEPGDFPCVYLPSNIMSSGQPSRATGTYPNIYRFHEYHVSITGILSDCWLFVAIADIESNVDPNDPERFYVGQTPFGTNFGVLTVSFDGAGQWDGRLFATKYDSNPYGPVIQLGVVANGATPVCRIDSISIIPEQNTAPISIQLTSVARVATLTNTVSPAASGTIALTPTGTGDDSNIYALGTGVSLEATPESGYIFDGWGGDIVSNFNPITTIMTADKTVQANFRLPLYAITVSCVGEGNISCDDFFAPSGVIYAADGATLSLTPYASPAEGNAFVKWNVDGGSDDPVWPLVLTNITADHTIVCTFAV